MHVPIWLGLACGGAMVAAVFAWWREWRLRRDLMRTPPVEHERALALPDRGAKFRVVLHTNAGARARDFYAHWTAKDDDCCEFWHYNELRSQKRR